MYDEFTRRNPNFEDRIEALTSGILTPDTKAAVLWAMEKDVFYTKSGLYAAAERFSGKGFPVVRGVAWNYCNGKPTEGFEGSLCSIGAVLKCDTIDTGFDSAIAYGKTDAGVDF